MELTKQEVETIVKQAIDKAAYDAQFRVGPIPYHAHTGVDSPRIRGDDLSDDVLARTASHTSTGNPMPPANSLDLFDITAATGAIAFQVPIGNAIDGALLRIRITSSNAATARAITWSTATGGYISNSPALPSATTTGKTSNLGFEYDASNSANKWRLLWSANS